MNTDTTSFINIVLDGMNHYYADLSEISQEIEDDGISCAAMGLDFDLTADLNSDYIIEMTANSLTDGLLNRKLSDELLIIYSLVVEADIMLDNVMESICEKVHCNPDIMTKWIESKTSEMDIVNTDRVQSCINAVLENKQ